MKPFHARDSVGNFYMCNSCR